MSTICVCKYVNTCDMHFTINTIQLYDKCYSHCTRNTCHGVRYTHTSRYITKQKSYATSVTSTKQKQTKMPSFCSMHQCCCCSGVRSLLQTPEWSESHPSEQSPVVCTVTRLQLSGTNSLFLSIILHLSVLSSLP